MKSMNHCHSLHASAYNNPFTFAPFCLVAYSMSYFHYVMLEGLAACEQFHNLLLLASSLSCTLFLG
ncbi:hypothetical protein GYMLUDRAFT_937333 [Collybiopsis luxurians FD-317 M1]|uniref:Uncharacterized protein n=1 Tax=Collybiopsis luxurians FD-317 M1 TaxID=944289 RepID=A0A0D0ASP2_9AGAR|nr:hypothetical protein GYMLUDRAFT_937333 [Collybiopsis luxurians FD-317 M1]